MDKKFKVGDKAYKPKGYAFPCTIVGVFETLKGEIRVVGEMDEYGLLHIFNEGQLEHVNPITPVKNTNKEQYNNIIDEVYKRYESLNPEYRRGEYGEESFNFYHLSKEQFITNIKYDHWFSEKWGLKIKERELSLEERYNIWFNNNYETGMERYFDPNNLPDFDNEYYEPTPTKLITVTYNNETIEVYE